MNRRDNSIKQFKTVQNITFKRTQISNKQLNIITNLILTTIYRNFYERIEIGSITTSNY
jgi:hypothetical protein